MEKHSRIFSVVVLLLFIISLTVAIHSYPSPNAVPKITFDRDTSLMCVSGVSHTINSAVILDKDISVIRNEENMVTSNGYMSINTDNLHNGIDNNIVGTATDDQYDYVDKYVPNPSKHTKKTYMQAKNITDKSSYQYKLKDKYELNDNGIFMVDNRYCIAVGSYYTTRIGTYIDVVMENGNVIKCILADCKADKDTDSQNVYHLCDGSVIEFVVDSRESLTYLAREMGDLSYLDPIFEGEISYLRIYKNVKNRKGVY